MKFIYFLIGISLLLSCEKKNLNKNEILEIIHSHEDYKNQELKTDFSYGDDFIDTLKIFRETIKKENFKSIYEADFNNDGKTDYLVNLIYPKPKDNEVKIFINEDNFSTAILLSSNKDYQLLNPGKSEVYDIISAKIINYKNENLIKLLSLKKYIGDKNDILKFDTLIVKNNQLTEFTKSVKNYTIEKIVFIQNGGFAPGKKYQLTLKKDSIILNSNFYKNLNGKYIGKNNSNFENIAKYLNEIHFNNLKGKYTISCSDCPSIETEIIFDNGKRKRIYDYGEKGTLGLLKFYAKIDTLMTQQKWKKIN